MTQIATRVPLGRALRKLLADVNPRGAATDVAATGSARSTRPRSTARKRC